MPKNQEMFGQSKSKWKKITRSRLSSIGQLFKTIRQSSKALFTRLDDVISNKEEKPPSTSHNLENGNADHIEQLHSGVEKLKITINLCHQEPRRKSYGLSKCDINIRRSYPNRALSVDSLPDCWYAILENLHNERIERSLRE